jgi:hypothetical protein
MHRLLVLCLALLVGCAAPIRPPGHPDGVVVVFADGFHSGIVLERADVPPRLLPLVAEAPWVAVHFGEQRWISGEADGVLEALRLGLSGGGGGVQVDAIDWWVHDRGGTDTSEVRVWAFPVTRAELAGVRARLDFWIEPDAVRHPLRPGACWWPASRDWTLRTNCHDFTVDLLDGAGIRVGRPPIMWASPLRAALDQAWSERDPGP